MRLKPKKTLYETGRGSHRRQPTPAIDGKGGVAMDGKGPFRTPAPFRGYPTALSSRITQIHQTLVGRWFLGPGNPQPANPQSSAGPNAMTEPQRHRRRDLAGFVHAADCLW